jgi:hypothetical protein
MRRPTMTEHATIREIAKKHHIEGCQPFADRTIVGKRNKRINQCVAIAFVNDLNYAGFEIESVSYQSIQSDICDVFLIYAT